MAILDFFNKQSKGTEGLTPINWEEYEASIHTPNVVRRIRAKYDSFMDAEFQVDGAIAKCGTRTEAMKALDVSMHYNYTVWLMHYLQHLDQIETLQNIGDPQKVGTQEMVELMPDVDLYMEGQDEIGNMNGDDYTEN